MDNPTDPLLRSLFEGYAPSMSAEPFMSRALETLAKEDRRARLRSDVVYGTLLLVCGCIAVASSGWVQHALPDAMTSFGSPFSNWPSFQGLWLRASGALPPVTAQVLTYGLTAAVAFVARRQIRAFLTPW